MIQWKDSSGGATAKATPTARRPLILLIDDQPDVLRIYSRMLNIAGYNTQTAQTAESALALAEAKRPDAVMVDLRMPYVNGLGLLYRFRKLYPQLPVAVITGMLNLDQSTVDEIAALRAPVYFKPLLAAELKDVADGLTGSQHAERIEPIAIDWSRQQEAVVEASVATHS